MFMRQCLTAVLLATVLSPAIAMEPNGGKPPMSREHHKYAHERCEHRHGMFNCLVGPLALTSEQQEKLYKLKGSFKDDVTLKRAQLKVDKHHLWEMLTASSVDKAQVRQQQSKINDEHNALANSKIDFILAMQDVLTPEQRHELRAEHIKHSLGIHERIEPMDAPVSSESESQNFDG